MSTIGGISNPTGVAADNTRSTRLGSASIESRRTPPPSGCAAPFWVGTANAWCTTTSVRRYEASRDVGAVHALIHRRLAADFDRAYRAKRIRRSGCGRVLGGLDVVVREWCNCGALADRTSAPTGVRHHRHRRRRATRSGPTGSAESNGPVSTDRHGDCDGGGDGGGLLLSVGGSAKSGVLDFSADDARVDGDDRHFQRGSAPGRD